MRTRWQKGFVTTRGIRGNKVYVGHYRDVDGKQREKKLGFVSEMTLSEARTATEGLCRENGSTPTSSRVITFGEYWELTYVPRHKGAWGPATEYGYKTYMRIYLTPALGKLRLTDINDAHLSAMFDNLRKDYARSVVTKVWTLTKSILESAIDDDIITKNPMRKVSYPKTKTPYRPILDDVSGESDDNALGRVLKAVQDDAFLDAIFQVGAFCAMRTSEVFGVCWSAFKGDHFLIRDSAWKGRLLTDAGKVGERLVSIPAETQAAILKWRKVSKFTGADDPIFCSTTGTVMSSHNFRNRVLVPLAEKLEFTGSITFQILRRDFATRNQDNVKDLQEHCGHSSPVTTLKIYAQRIPQSVAKMVADDAAAILKIRDAIAG